MKTATKKTLQLAHDVAFRLGCEVAIVSTRCVKGYENHAITLPNLNIEQVNEVLEWLDYYVPTIDEQRSSQHGPTIQERPTKPAVRGAA